LCGVAYRMSVSIVGSTSDRTTNPGGACGPAAAPDWVGAFDGVDVFDGVEEVDGVGDRLGGGGWDGPRHPAIMDKPTTTATRAARAGPARRAVRRPRPAPTTSRPVRRVSPHNLGLTPMHPIYQDLRLCRPTAPDPADERSCHQPSSRQRQKGCLVLPE